MTPIEYQRANEFMHSNKQTREDALVWLLMCLTAAFAALGFELAGVSLW